MGPRLVALLLRHVQFVFFDAEIKFNLQKQLQMLLVCVYIYFMKT